MNHYFTSPKSIMKHLPRALALAAALACGAASAATFTDVSTAAGFTGNNASWGMAWLDYNKDGFADVLTYNHLQDVTGSIGMQLWRNNGNGTFTDVTTAAGLIYMTGDTHGVSVGDVNGDGYPDIYLVNGSVKSNVVDLDKLWINNTNGTFTEIGVSAGVQGIDARGRGAYMFDANRDGKLDLFVTRFDRPDSNGIDKDLGNQIFVNNGNLTFTDIGKTAGIDRALAENRAGTWGDFDGDGRQDILVTGPCVLWKANADGTYTDVTASAGIVASDECTAAHFADYDRDGDLDLFVSRGFDVNTLDALYQNNGNGTFTDVSATAGINTNLTKRGISWGDYDNDGWLDIYVVTLNNGNQPNRLYHNKKDGTFEEVSLAEGSGAQVTGNGASATFVDYDNDGDLDLFVTNGEGNAAGPYVLLQNGGNTNKWLQMNLQGKNTSNPDALGAKVSATSATTGTQYLWNHGPQHFLSQSLLPMHMGLGTDVGVSTMTVTWPSGTAQKVDNVAANQRITLVEGKSIWQDSATVAKVGAYVQQLGTRWRIVFKGDTSNISFTGRITSTANITSLTTQGFETTDSVVLTNSKQLDFTVGQDGKGVDTFEFVTTSNNVTVDIQQNGVASPQTTYLGRYMVKPMAFPLALKR